MADRLSDFYQWQWNFNLVNSRIRMFMQSLVDQIEKSAEERLYLDDLDKFYVRFSSTPRKLYSVGFQKPERLRKWSHTVVRGYRIRIHLAPKIKFPVSTSILIGSRPLVNHKWEKLTSTIEFTDYDSLTIFCMLHGLYLYFRDRRLLPGRLSVAYANRFARAGVKQYQAMLGVDYSPDLNKLKEAIALSDDEKFQFQLNYWNAAINL